MKKIYILFFNLILFFLFANHTSAQSIEGKVIDAQNSEPLVGATIKIINTSYGAITDLDGFFRIENLPGGTYQIKVSYIGYTDKVIEGVVVNPKKVTNLNVALEIDGLSTEIINVEATISLSNESALLSVRKSSENITDGVSEQQIKKNPDATASEILKRVTGLSIVDNKYVYVRGINERYSVTMLNGSQLPSTESDKKSFSFDIIPSALLENIIITKSYTPDLPGNFSGGLVQINTKEFPENLSIGFSSSLSYNTNTTDNNILTSNSPQSKLLFLNSGFDNGDRLLPSFIPSQKIDNTNFTNAELKTFGRAFNNNWGVNYRRAPLNGSFQISAGNRFRVLNNDLGLYFAYTYNSAFKNKNTLRREYLVDGGIEQEFTGKSSSYNVQWGGILNASYKIGLNHQISWRNSFILTSEDETMFMQGTYFPQTAERKLFSTHFTVREIQSSQLNGEHYFEKLAKTRLSFKLGYSVSKAKEPDYKTMIYQREYGTDDPFMAPISFTGNPNTTVGGRFFSDLQDIFRNIELNLETPLKIKNIQSKVKIGGVINHTTRDFSARLFAPYFSNQINIFEMYRIMKLPLDSIFLPENIDTNKIVYAEFTDLSDRYTAFEDNYAAFAMLDFQYKKFRVITGARLEYNFQKLNSHDRTGVPIDVSLKNVDILPSVNLIYALDYNTNLRFSFFQSVSRPELREISPFGFNDFSSNIFIYGNPYDLRRSLVRNFDIRIENFLSAAEIVSLSVFYKKFDAPIERVFLVASSDAKSNTFQNAKRGATNVGLELELRKNLGFISKVLSNFSLNSNLSLINSKVDLSGTGANATKISRKMQGQSPYTINFGLYYDNLEAGTSINLSYNKFGKRISEVGIDQLGDIEENGIDLVDITIIQKLFKFIELKLSIKNLLNDSVKFTQEVNGTDQVVRSFDIGRTYNFSFGIKF
ncbi:MAG: outer membrane beta-barrel protein [Ignavibacteria bacterium]